MKQDLLDKYRHTLRHLGSGHDEKPLVIDSREDVIGCVCTQCQAAKHILELIKMIDGLEGPPCNDCGHTQDAHMQPKSYDTERCLVVECNCWAYKRKR